MKTRIFLIAIAAIIFCNFKASAQFSLGLNGSWHSKSGANDKDAWGNGLQGKYFFKKIPLAVGGNIRHWVNNYEKTSVNDQDLRTMDMATSFSAFAEWYFGAGKIRPYAGADIGMYASNLNLEFKEKSFAFDGNNRQTNFGVAPKAGVLFKTGIVSPFIQAQYNFLFSGKTEGTVPEVSNAKSSFVSVDAGVLFNFPKCKCGENKQSN